MKLVVLDAQTLGDDLDLSPLKEFGELEIYQTTTPNQRTQRIQGANIVITNKVILDREILNKAKDLKLICITATGVNNVDLEVAKELNIEVKNVAGYSTDSVTQHTFAMLFYLLEQLNYYDDFVKSKAWSNSGLFTHLGRPFYEIKGKEWGIIGLGSIGEEVAKIASSFGAKVSYYATSGVPHSTIYPHKELKELLKSSHIISIHAPLNKKTLRLLAEEELALIQDRAILLNLGRGGIIDEEALANELERRELYCGLDVTKKEPIAQDSPLLNLSHPKRLLITPHIAWTSKEARERLLEGVIDNIKEFLGA